MLHAKRHVLLSFVLPAYDFPRDVLLSINHYHCWNAGLLLIPLKRPIKWTFKILYEYLLYLLYINRARRVSYTILNGDYGLYWARHYLRFQGKRKRGHRGYGEPHCRKAVHVASIGECEQRDYRHCCRSVPPPWYFFQRDENHHRGTCTSTRLILKQYCVRVFVKMMEKKFL